MNWLNTIPDDILRAIFWFTPIVYVLLLNYIMHDDAQNGEEKLWKFLLGILAALGCLASFLGGIIVFFIFMIHVKGILPALGLVFLYVLVFGACSAPVQFLYMPRNELNKWLARTFTLLGIGLLILVSVLSK
jgi:hypothetical protein